MSLDINHLLLQFLGVSTAAAANRKPTNKANPNLIGVQSR